MEKDVEGIKRIMKKLCLLLIMFMISGCSNSYKTIDKEKSIELIKNNEAILIDVRSIVEYQEGHIMGAKSYPVTTILNDIEEDYDKNTYIIVYCKSGNRSKIAAEGLIELGYKNVYDLGSINNWS